MPAGSVASAATLHADAIELGDVIFVSRKSKGSWLSRMGQWFLVLGRHERPVRFHYAHVAMGISPGLVLHADGKSICFEALEKAVGAGEPGANFRVARRTEPPLSASQKSAMRLEAERYLGQPYSFVPGRYSSWLGRAIRLVSQGLGRQTRPFCSELITYAYRAAGVRFGLSPDRAYPADLDRVCRGPGWSDVTSLYHHDTATDILALVERSGLSRADEVASFVRSLEIDFSDAHAILAMGSNAKFGAIEVIAQGLSTLLKATQLDLQEALSQAKNPRVLLERRPELISAYLSQLPEYYDTIDMLPGSINGDIAESLSALFPDCPPDEPPFEGLPSLAELQRQDGSLKLAMFGIATIRLEAILGGLCASAGLLDQKADPRFADLEFEMVREMLALLPPLERDRAERLRLRLSQSFDQDKGAELGKLPALADALIRYHLALLESESPAAP
ncbi:hypothetical protein [Phenylobacterium sp.]|uniref:hypothetical protein n=1 Tax=Phenylobacterium sp. TaxID=1871053 RepID=UPI003BAA02D8